MPGCSGIDLMTVFHQDDDLLPILLITGHGDVPMSGGGGEKGAWDFLQKADRSGQAAHAGGRRAASGQSVIARRQYCPAKITG